MKDTKEELRRHLLAKRLGIPEVLRRHHEGVIREHIRAFGPYERSKTVALYFPVRGEVDLLPLLSDRTKRYVFPRIVSQGMVFSPASSEQEFVPGALGIPEPAAGSVVAAREVDLFLVPGIAFDRYGHRLGYGKGFYDRLLGGNPDVVSVGVCLDEFLVEELPADPWDARVGYVATQAGIHKEGEE